MKLGRKKMKADVPSVAMGDIAFNLIIFFVVLAGSEGDRHIKYNPATTPVVEKVEKSRVTVVIDVDHKLYLNGGQISEMQLGTALKDALGDAKPGDRTVVVKIDKDTPALRFEPVIAAISEAGGELVHMLKDQAAPTK